MDKTNELPTVISGTTGILEEESKTLLNTLYEYRLYFVVFVVLVVLGIGGYYLYTKYYLDQDVEKIKVENIDNFAEVHEIFNPTNQELDQVKHLNKEQEAREKKILEQELKSKLNSMNQTNNDNDRIQEDVTNVYVEPQIVQQYDLSQGELDNIANELAQ
jgi:hypothetical protein